MESADYYYVIITLLLTLLICPHDIAARVCVYLHYGRTCRVRTRISKPRSGPLMLCINYSTMRTTRGPRTDEFKAWRD